MELETERLLLRQWKESDLVVFQKLNSDPEVMEYFPATLSQEESDAVAQKCKEFISDRGWSFWAVELKSSNEFIGFVGLHEPDSKLPFTPCVEIGWRLLKSFWGKGYATEAAHKSLEYSFNELGLSEVVSFTTVSNLRSRAVMEKLGLKNSKQNFEHPDVPKEHPLSEHVLYKITKAEWQTKLMKPQS